MDVRYVVPLSTDPPRWVQQSRASRGLDPRTGRRPEKVGTPLLGGVVGVVLTLGAVGLFGWLCVALTATFLS